MWPPAGIAVAGILLLGRRAWPGVWLGSFAVNLSVAYQRAGAVEVLEPALIAATIGAGASLQACLGAFLVRRFVGYPNALETERSVVKFLLCAGPVSCHLGATWAPPGE